MNVKGVAVLGSTGSIGLTTLGIISKKKNLFLNWYDSFNFVIRI